jgi:hypothetical protein
MNNKSLLLGVGIGVGVLVVGGVTAFAVMHYKKKEDEEQEARARSAAAPATVNVFAPRDRVIGRPFGDPFRPRYGQSVWGHDVWAYRSPRVRPVSPRRRN